MIIKKGYENGSTAVWVQGVEKPLRIGRNVRMWYGEDRTLDELPDGWEAEYDLTYEITKFDSDLPMYVHEVVCTTPDGVVNGCIIGDHGIHTGSYPLLKFTT